jgi:hypothetical protein
MKIFEKVSASIVLIVIGSFFTVFALFCKGMGWVFTMYVLLLVAALLIALGVYEIIKKNKP